MAKTTHDLIAIGGGLGGAALAMTMAKAGADVLVLERTRTFSDRIRGEWIAPWGVSEATKLGLLDLLEGSCGHRLPAMTMYFGGRPVPRDDSATTPRVEPAMTFFHPEMQEVVLSAARESGANVRRGVRVRSLETGNGQATVEVEGGGKVGEATARLVVGADGRDSVTRAWAGFELKKGKQGRLGTGLALEDVDLDPASAHVWFDTTIGQCAFFFPWGGGRGRAYVTTESRRFSGQKEAPDFLDEWRRLGVSGDVAEKVQPFGLLATIDMTDRWVDHPYRAGVALIGDAAGATDPTWGQGLSLTLRDVNTLSVALKSDSDWNAAGHAYAKARDAYFGTVMTYESWVDEMLMTVGSEADARRARVTPLWREDPTRVPGVNLSGPDNKVLDERARRRYFGEE